MPLAIYFSYSKLTDREQEASRQRQMKTPLGSAVQVTEVAPSTTVKKRPSVLGEGRLFSLEAMQHLHVPSPNHRSFTSARLLMRTGRLNLCLGFDVLLMPPTRATTALHQQKPLQRFDYSIKSTEARHPTCSTTIACMTELPTTKTPPSTELTSLQAAVPAPVIWCLRNCMASFHLVGGSASLTVSVEGKFCTMSYAQQNLRSTLSISPVARRTGRSLDIAPSSRTPLGAKTVQGAARHATSHGYESVIRAPGHAGRERGHSTSHAGDASSHSSLRANRAGRATAQATHLAWVLGAVTTDRRTNRPSQRARRAHCALPDGLERCVGKRRAARVLRVPGRRRSLPYPGGQRDSAGSIRSEHRTRRRQDSVRHRGLHSLGAGRDQPITRTARAPRNATARRPTSIYAGIQRPRIQALSAHTSPSLPCCLEHGGRVTSCRPNRLNHLRPATDSAPRDIAAPRRALLQAAHFTATSARRNTFFPHSPPPAGAAYQLDVVAPPPCLLAPVAAKHPQRSPYHPFGDTEFGPLLIAGLSVPRKTHTSLDLRRQPAEQ